MPKPRSVYRGKRKYSWLITLAAMLLILLIILAVWLFYYLQRYIVYDKDGLHLDLSAPRAELQPPATEGPLPPAERVEVEIVVEHKDYSQVVTDAGRDLAPMRALSVPAAELTESTLTYYTANMGDFDALVLELKGTDGLLRYHSGVALAESYAVNGTLELAPLVSQFKEKGIYMVAQLSALTDSAMSQRNAPIALKNSATGAPLADADGSGWLDPYSEDTRAYLLDLLTELRDMGFDEVLLTGLTCPDSEYLQFSLDMTKAPDAVGAVSSLALWLREQADALGLRLSAVLRGDTLRNGEAKAGQDPVLFFKAFDRVAVETDVDHLAADRAAMEAALGGPSAARIAFITQDYTPEAESYIVR